MAGFRTFMLLMQVVPGLLLVGLSVPLILRKVPPNRWYGFRVRWTLDNPPTWYEANAYFGKCLLAAGIAIVVGSVALFEVPALDGPCYYAVACPLLTLGSAGLAAVLSFRSLGRIAKSPEPR
jgi:hypothetical protein